MIGRYLLAKLGVAVAFGLAFALLSVVASAQQCGPRQVFDPANVQLGQLACQSCQGGTARASALSRNDVAEEAELAQTLRALSATIADLNGKVRQLEGGRAMGSGGTPSGASAYAEVNGGAAKPLYLVNSGGNRAVARAEANASDFNELPPLALASLNAGNSASASAVSGGGCGGGGCGRVGLLGRLGGRRTVNISVARSITRSR